MTKAVYIELDALLDTRLGTIASINSEAAKRAIMDPRYHNREKDSFLEICGIDDETFQAGYSTRDTDTLKASTLTNFPVILMEIIRELEVQRVTIPESDDFVLDINIWPYQLSDQERNLIELAVQRHSGINTPVRTVTIPYDELTPMLIKDRFPVMVMYNFNDWVVRHRTLFGRHKIPSTTILIPRIHYKDPVDPNDPEVQDFLIEDPYLRTAKFLALFVNLEFVPVKEFCPLRHWELDDIVAREQAALAAHTTQEPR